MGNKCMVIFCKSRGRIPGIKYFSLSAKRHDAWLTALGRNPNEQLSFENCVCSLHFTDDDFITINSKLTLKPGAIPTRALGIRRSLILLHVTQPVTSCRSEKFTVPEENSLCTNKTKVEPVEEDGCLERLSAKHEVKTGERTETCVLEDKKPTIKIENTDETNDIVFDCANVKHEEVDIKGEDIFEEGLLGPAETRIKTCFFEDKNRTLKIVKKRRNK